MVEYSVASKTFLLGEYVALDGGPSLILSTKPRFVLKSTNRKVPAIRSLFSPQSPAGRLQQDSGKDVSGCEMHDPHQGRGGFGASSAQFALLYCLIHKFSDPFNEFKQNEWKDLLSQYRTCSWQGQGAPPSGADVVAQLVGGICWFDGRNHQVERLNWDFKHLSFTLLRTGFKLATHEHLTGLGNLPFESLRECVQMGKDALRKSDAGQMVVAVERCAGILSESGLTNSSTLGILQAVRTQVSGVLAAKGCGAMGADVIAVLHDPAVKTNVLNWAQMKGLDVCGTEAELDPTGLIRFDSKPEPKPEPEPRKESKQIE